MQYKHGFCKIRKNFVKQVNYLILLVKNYFLSFYRMFLIFPGLPRERFSYNAFSALVKNRRIGYIGDKRRRYSAQFYAFFLPELEKK